MHSLSGTEGTDVDGDICYDVVAEKVDISTIITVPELTIPCSGSEGTVQLQFCSSWRSEEENEDCRVNGASPCSFDGCACEMVDLGVEIVSPENAVSFAAVVLVVHFCFEFVPNGFVFK